MVEASVVAWFGNTPAEEGDIPVEEDILADYNLKISISVNIIIANVHAYMRDYS